MLETLRGVVAWNQQRRALLWSMLLIAIVDALMTQLNFEPWIPGFNISLSVAILPVLLYLNPRVNPLLQTALIMVLGLLSRLLVEPGHYASLAQALQAEYKQIYFEIAYGLIYYFFFYRRPEKTLTLWSGVILAADFLANVVELLSRTAQIEAIVLPKLPELFLIAVIRSTLATLIVLGYAYYRDLLRREEHQRRYERLVMITSQLSAENYLMQKNMQQIESVMGNAYSLYEGLEAIGHEGSRHALNIAKDVHEIKKSYHQVMQGLQTLTNAEVVSEQMRIKDLMEILRHCLANDWQGKGELPVKFDCLVDAVVSQHFLLLSVVRNLVVNALEALDGKEFPHVAVRIYSIAAPGEGRLVIEVSDNGQGIPQKDVAIIYQPGFSTKFSPLTGDIQRGLGLTLVKEIVESALGGTIAVRSTAGVGTSFKVTVPMERLVKL